MIVTYLDGRFRRKRKELRGLRTIQPTNRSNKKWELYCLYTSEARARPGCNPFPGFTHIDMDRMLNIRVEDGETMHVTSRDFPPIDVLSLMVTEMPDEYTFVIDRRSTNVVMGNGVFYYNLHHTLSIEAVKVPIGSIFDGPVEVKKVPRKLRKMTPPVGRKIIIKGGAQ